MQPLAERWHLHPHRGALCLPAPPPAPQLERMAAAAQHGGPLAHQYSVPATLAGGLPRLSSLAAFLLSPEAPGAGAHSSSAAASAPAAPAAALAGAATSAGSTLLGKLGRLAGAAHAATRRVSRSGNKEGPTSPPEGRSARTSATSLGSGGPSQSDLQHARGLSFTQLKGGARVAPEDAV